MLFFFNKKDFTIYYERSEVDGILGSSTGFAFDRLDKFLETKDNQMTRLSNFHAAGKIIVRSFHLHEFAYMMIIPQ